MMDKIYESGRTTRYHANYRFNRLLQTNADHQWGCAAIVLALHPNPSIRLVRRAIFHDGGEFLAGDLPYPFKIANPELADRHIEVERNLAISVGIPGLEDNLSEEEVTWVKFADRFESFLFAKFHSPETLREPGWQLQTGNLVAVAKDLGIYDEIKEVLTTDD